MKLLAVSLYALILTINCFAKDKSNGLCRGIDETIVLKDKKTDKLKGVLVCSKQVPSRGVVIFKDKNDDGILDKNDTVAYFISKKFQVFRNVLANKIDGFDEELKRYFEYSGQESTYYQIYIEDLIEVSNLKSIHKSILNPGGPEENSEEIEEDVSFDDLSVEDLYRQRYYSPKTGTFISPDPLGLASGDPNPYRYVGNNPINLTDPFGLSPGDLFTTPERAALDAHNFFNTQSQQNDREFGVVLYVNKDGTYSYTNPNIGEVGSGTVDIPRSPPGTIPVGAYHTHGYYNPGGVNDFFSSRDKRAAINSLQSEYLGTPSGFFLKYNPFTAITSRTGERMCAP